MGQETKIEWTRFTLNVWEGCFEVSPGCDNCYAKAMNKRYYGGRHWSATGPRRLVKGWRAKLATAKRVAVKEGRRVPVFVSSISDIFEKIQPVEGQDDQTIEDLRMEFFQAVEQTPECTFLLLTKRPQNIRKYLPPSWVDAYSNGCPDNVWFGCSVVNQAELVMHVPWLLLAPGLNKFLSLEPMLGPIDLSYALASRDFNGNLIPNPNPAISWVIAGGESGHKGKARPLQPEWLQQVKDDCDYAGARFFFKQWGNHTPMSYESDAGKVTTMTYNKNPHYNDFPFGSGQIHQSYPPSMTCEL